PAVVDDADRQRQPPPRRLRAHPGRQVEDDLQREPRGHGAIIHDDVAESSDRAVGAARSEPRRVHGSRSPRKLRRRLVVVIGVGERGSLGAVRGAALYVGALIGPGVLLVPALAVQAAGAASIVAWTALLVLSAPLAITFAALGVRHPVAGGVSAYVREGFGDAAAAVTGGW